MQGSVDPPQQELQNLKNLLNQGRLEEVVRRVSILTQDYSNSVALHNIAGAANAALLRYAEALASFDKAIQLNPGYASLHYNRGCALYELKRFDEAVAGYDKAIELNPGYVDAHDNRGNALQELKRFDEAVASHDKAARLSSLSARPYYNRATALYELKRLSDAVASFDKAIQLSPGNADAYYNRGTALQDLERFDDAIASFDRAIRLNPGYANACYNRGIALAKLEQLVEAIASYDRAIQLNPDHVPAHNNRGNVLQTLKRFDEAIASYGRATQLDPNYAEAYNNWGNALRELQRCEEAVARFDQAIRLEPESAETHHNRGHALQELGRLDEAIASYDRACQLKPDHAAAMGNLTHLRSHICDWSEANHAAGLSRIGIEGNAIYPFVMLAQEDDPASHLERAKNWTREKCAHAPAVVFAAPDKREKLRIGYFSADFHNHATMYLMASLFGLHDKSKFEIHAFSFGTSSSDEMRQRLLRDVDEFHDVRGLSDKAVAELARSRSIDIAVDLKGYTYNGRPTIFSYRAAPIQINYLGYPGSMGADFIDYIVADRILIPESAQRFYSEKVIYLPDSYQVNDRSRAISDRQFTRPDLGLPDDGFVFCCFNNNYKISPVEFDIWMRLLARVGAGVLWLLSGNPWAEVNLRKEAAAQGIDPRRLVFAEKMALPDHLARHRCADLFLDTFNVNAHTTASDALWAGLPVVTKLGEGFAARVAGSLLNAIGMPELVTATPADYEQLALELATNPDRLAAVKAKLLASRMTTALFDTERFTRHLEQAYEMVYARYAHGLPADDIEVPALTSSH